MRPHGEEQKIAGVPVVEIDSVDAEWFNSSDPGKPAGWWLTGEDSLDDRGAMFYLPTALLPKNDANEHFLILSVKFSDQTKMLSHFLTIPSSNTRLCLARAISAPSRRLKRRRPMYQAALI